MVIFAKLIGLLIAAMGATWIVRLDWMKRMAGFWTEGNNLYVAGFVRMTIGLVMLLAAFWSVNPASTAILGGMFFVAGVELFIVPLEDSKKLIAFWVNQEGLGQGAMMLFFVC